MSDEARVLRQNDVCKTLITIDLAVVAATIAIVGSSKPISVGIGWGSILLTGASIAFVVSMVDLINTPDTNRSLSRAAFFSGLGLSLAGFVLLVSSVAFSSAPPDQSEIMLEGNPNGMTLRIPGLCSSSVEANAGGAIVKVTPPSINRAGAKPSTAQCAKDWRVETSLKNGQRVTLTPVTN